MILECICREHCTMHNVFQVRDIKEAMMAAYACHFQHGGHMQYFVIDGKEYRFPYRKRARDKDYIL